MKKVGKVCYGKYEGGIVYKEDKNNFFIDVNNKKINIIDLRPDPDYEIDSSYYTMSDKEASNLGFSIGLGGLLGAMAFNGIKGSNSYSINWLDGSYSNFEFDNADDEEASIEFFSLIKILQFNENFWKKIISNSNFYNEEEEGLFNWLERNKKDIIYEILSYKDNLNQWQKNSKYYECFLFMTSIYNLLNNDFDKRVYSVEIATTMINKVANINTIQDINDIFIDFIPNTKAKTLVNNGSITSQNLINWAESFNGSVENFSQFLDTILKLMKEDKSLEEIVIYMFKEQYKFFYKTLKLAVKNAIMSN